MFSTSLSLPPSLLPSIRSSLSLSLSLLLQHVNGHVIPLILENATVKNIIDSRTWCETWFLNDVWSMLSILYETGGSPWDIEMTVEESLSDDEDGVPHCVSDVESVTLGIRKSLSTTFMRLWCDTEGIRFLYINFIFTFIFLYSIFRTYVDGYHTFFIKTLVFFLRHFYFRCSLVKI